MLPLLWFCGYEGYPLNRHVNMAGAGSDQGVVEVEPVVHIVEVLDAEHDPESVHYPPTEEYLDGDLLQTTVPDPIRLRGVGGTTL